MYRNIRKIYNISKLDKQHNILVSKILNKTDFKLIQIHSSDNHQSHAVCVTQDYIFDCNASNALPMSLEGLNCSCGENAEFQGIVYGYHFVKRISSHKMLTNEVNKFEITIKYQVKDSNVPNCPYTSLANILHQIGFKRESKIILHLKEEYVNQLKLSLQKQTQLRHIANQLTNNNDLNQFTKKYMYKKLDNKFRLFQNNNDIGKHDFILIAYLDTKSNQYLYYCVTCFHIYDCSCLYAISINDCTKQQYSESWKNKQSHGYHFSRRSL